MMTTTDHLDIPDFLRRHDEQSAPAYAEPVKPVRRRKKKHPPGWFTLTKAEQDGTADPATVALRRQAEREKKDKQAARFARLRELAAERRKK